MLWWCVLVVAPLLAHAQHDAFALPQLNRYAPKPTVPPEYRNFFELDGHARELVDSLMGPRPGGLFPEKTFDIGEAAPVAGEGGPIHKVSPLERTLESFFTAPENAGQAFPPGFNPGGGGFSLLNNQNTLASFGNNNVRRAPQKSSEQIEGSGAVEASESSIARIPKVFPKIPKVPLNLLENNALKQQSEPIIVDRAPVFPQIQSAPAVPEGGFLPGDVRRSPQSVSGVASSIDEAPSDINGEEYGGLSEDTSSASSSGGLIGTIINLIGLGNKKAQEKKDSNSTAAPEQKNVLAKSMADLLGGPNSPLSGNSKSMFSNLLYKALTSGTLKGNETDDGNSTIVLTPAQSATIGENLEMVKNMIIQSDSPLCTNKPEPVDFELEPFMGQWYQVVYSPPMSAGPCSMVAYKKLSGSNDVGGVGSIFEIFEYTTDGSPYGKPKITSGYAIIKGAGQLIYRTTSNSEDVIVNILHTGPQNRDKQYEYMVLSINCNMPLHVFARDPVTYKQKYENDVNRYLESKGLVNGISRLLNIVAPVDNSMCTFPPSLFNIAG